MSIALNKNEKMSRHGPIGPGLTGTGTPNRRLKPVDRMVGSHDRL